MSDLVECMDQVNTLLDAMQGSYVNTEHSAQAAERDSYLRRGALTTAGLEYKLAVEILADARNNAPFAPSVDSALNKVAAAKLKWTQARIALLGY